MSKAPWPPPPPVDETPEFGGAGALGGNGGSGSGPFGAAGRCERPPEAELFTVERTADRATLCAELELVSSVAVALVLSSTRRNLLRLTIERDMRVTPFGLCADRSRSCWATGPTGSGTAATTGGAPGIGCGAAARTTTGSVPTTVTGSLGDAGGGAASSAAGAGA